MISKSKLLFVIDNLGSGGAQNQMVMLAIELKKRGYDISFFTYYPQDFFKSRLDTSQIPVLFSPKKDKAGISVIRSLIKTYRSEKPDIVISFLDTPNFYSALAKKFFKGKIKLITSERSATDFRKKNIRNLIKRFSHSQADHIVTNSVHEKDVWEKHYPLMVGKISCIYNGVDLNNFPKKEDFSFTYNLLCIGSISPYKNGLFVIEMVKVLRERFCLRINITWVGEKQNHIKERKNYCQKMEAKILDYKLNTQWTWVQPSNQINDLFLSHDALIHASTIEGLPNVVCEAMACGLPVFLSNVLDHPNLIKNGVNGFLMDLGCPETAAKQVFDFYNMAATDIITISQNSRNYAFQNLSKDKMLSNYLQLIMALN